MKKRLVIPSLLIGTLLIGGSMALAGPFGFGGGHLSEGRNGKNLTMSSEERGERLEHLIDMMSMILDLTAEQKDQVTMLFRQQWQDKQERREKLRAGEEQLRKYVLGNQFNEEELRSLAEQQARLKIDMLVEHARFKQQVHLLLTTEQQAKADKLLAAIGDKRRGRHGWGLMH